ncbi:MAG: ATP-dependent helicase, partial [Lachnospiraceae bacterium]|nr:ATP-dependent helicase [Lachnospiraceae bacterium]
RILNETEKESFRILALTFTNKAAQEMSERILEGVDNVEHRLYVGTFHSFCSEVLRNHGSYIGLKSDFDIYSSDDDLNDVINDICDRYKDINSTFPAQELKLLNMIRFFEKKLCYTEDEIIAAMPKTEYADAYKWIYQEYLKIMIARCTLDFDLLILLTYRLFVCKPAIARIYSKTYRYINVDEFQDTNYGQYMLLTSMCGKINNNIFIVADDDQVIYGWNGADHKRIAEFKNEYKADLIQLNQNFRCPREVIQAANNLITHNAGRERTKKPLEAMKADTDNNPHIFCSSYSDEKFEVNAITGLIKKIEEENPDDSICVLARTNRLLELAFQSANSEGIKCEKTKRKNDFETPYILWMFLLLKLANHRTDKKILTQLVGVMNEGMELSVNDDEVILESDIMDGDLLKALRSKCCEEFEDEEFAKSFSLNLVEGKNFIQFIDDAFAWSEMRISGIEDDAYREQMLQNYEIEKKVWIDFQRHLSYNYDLTEIMLSTYIQEFSMVSKEEEPKKGSVQFLTIHASKGKEFDHVILIGMANDELPSFQSLKKGIDSTEMEEERRNCFVAITRAKKFLYLTYSENYFGWKKQPSFFLNEMFAKESFGNSLSSPTIKPHK